MTSGTKKPVYTYHLTLDGATIDGKVSEICKEFLGTILALHQFEEFGGIVDELHSFIGQICNVKQI